MPGANERTTLGCLEWVEIPSLGVEKTLAKVDTGAFTGALHCTDIKVVRRNRGKLRVLKFKPLGKASLATETDKFWETHARSAFGHRRKRYIIETSIELNGKSYSVMIGLSDRKDMQYSVLLGRRFLRDNNMLVDVRLNEELDSDGKKTHENSNTF